MAIYCSDVSGAFDRVRSSRLISKLRAAGISEKLVNVIAAWLEPRTARVCVDGVLSDPFVLEDMVFQGTVLGPPFWNVFYADARQSISNIGFEECVFADDLNCWKVFKDSSNNTDILQACHECQKSLHSWGAANQVIFESEKESTHILDKLRPHGDNFKILGVLFDPKLSMFYAAQKLSTEASWRLKALLRTGRFYTTRDMVRLYKCHVLSFIEGATSAIFHATDTVLKMIDDIQIEFLDHLSLTNEAALCEFNLAPLSMRRDISILGLLFKVSLGIAPPALSSLFPPVSGHLERHGFTANRRFHSRALKDPIEPGHHPMLQRSIFGMVSVFNHLPQRIVGCHSVKSFQRALQKEAKVAASSRATAWPSLFSARSRAY